MRSETDPALYWTTLRVFTRTLRVLLDELDLEATWTKVVEEGWSNRAPETRIVVSDSWRLGLLSTTNTLAALLKVEPSFDVRLESKIERHNFGEAKRLVFARNLLDLSGRLLAEFDATSAR